MKSSEICGAGILRLSPFSAPWQLYYVVYAAAEFYPQKSRRGGSYIHDSKFTHVRRRSSPRVAVDNKRNRDNSAVVTPLLLLEPKSLRPPPTLWRKLNDRHDSAKR